MNEDVPRLLQFLSLVFNRILKGMLSVQDISFICCFAFGDNVHLEKKAKQHLYKTSYLLLIFKKSSFLTIMFL